VQCSGIWPLGRCRAAGQVGKKITPNRQLATGPGYRYEAQLLRRVCRQSGRHRQCGDCFAPVRGFACGFVEWGQWPPFACADPLSTGFFQACTSDKNPFSQPSVPILFPRSDRFCGLPSPRCAIDAWRVFFARLGVAAKRQR